MDWGGKAKNKGTGMEEKGREVKRWERLGKMTEKGRNGREWKEKGDVKGGEDKKAGEWKGTKMEGKLKEEKEEGNEGNKVLDCCPKLKDKSQLYFGKIYMTHLIQEFPQMCTGTEFLVVVCCKFSDREFKINISV